MRGRACLTVLPSSINIAHLMSADSSTVVDVWRMVSARRVLEGEVALSELVRLNELLDETSGTVRYRIEFGRDTLQVAFAALHIEAELPLQCQRSLESFVLPVRLEQTLGLIRNEAEEAALPPGFEAFLVPGDGRIQPLELVEDELILAVPLVPVAPDSEAVERDWPVQEEEVAAASPFAALAALKTAKD